MAETGPKAQRLTSLAELAIDWAALAKGFDMPACCVQTDREFAGALERMLTEDGPALIEAVLA